MDDTKKTRAQLIAELAQLRQEHAAQTVAVPAPAADYARVFDAIPLPATLVDAQGIVVDVNQAFLTLARSYGLEIRREDRIGGHIASFSATEGERIHFRDFIAELLQTGEARHLLFSGEDASGSQRIWNVHAAVLRDSVGKVTGALVLREDITEHRQAERALLQSSRLIALGQMAAGMAHELNQPLTVISAMAEGLQIRLAQGIEMTAERLKRWSGDVIEGVERMSTIIEHLRTFSRDRPDEPEEQVAINDVVRGTLTMTQAQLKNRGIDVALDLDDELVPILGDQYRLEQVLINLIHNARDAVEEKRERLPDSDRDDWRMRIHIRTFRERDQVVLEVEDNGTGMDEETRLQVLEPFFTTKGPDRGTGLGLSISHAIVKDQGGEIDCESQEGVGTVFRVRLPS